MKNFSFSKKQIPILLVATIIVAAISLRFASWPQSNATAMTDYYLPLTASPANLMMCTTAKPITRWNRLSAAEVATLNDNDPTTNVTDFHTGFCNGMNSITVDITATGAANSGNPATINLAGSNRWGLTSFNNGREEGGSSGNTMCFTFSDPQAIELNSNEHQFFHGSEHIVVTALDDLNAAMTLAGNLQGTAGPIMAGSGTTQVSFDGNGLVESGAWWAVSSNGNLAKTVCVEYYLDGPGQNAQASEPFTLNICDQTRCLFDDPFALTDPDNPTPAVAIADSLYLTKTTQCTAPAASGVPGNVDVTFRMVMTNNGNSVLSNLQIEDDLADHIPAAAFAGVIGVQIVALPNSTATPPTFNPGFTGTSSIQIFTGNDGQLLPGEELAIDLTVELDPNQFTAYQNITNQSFATALDATMQFVTAASDAPAGQPGDETAGNVDVLLLRIPSINISKFVADYLTTPSCNAAGDVSVTLRYRIENTGNINLDSLTLQDDLLAQLAGGLVAIDVSPTITVSTATTNPTLNPSYTGIAPNTNIFNGNTGLLAPGEMIEITIQLRLDPNDPLASNPLQNQAFVLGRGVDLSNTPYPGCVNGVLVATDFSDSGDVPESYNPTALGATPNNQNDPLPLILPNIGLAKTVVSFTPAASLVPGNLDVRFRMVIKNTGNTSLNNVQISDDLVAQLGPAYIGIVSPPTIVATTAAVNPMLGSFPANILDGTSGQLNQNQSITVEFVAELNPDALGLNYPLNNQATATATGTGPMGSNIQVSALSDGGIDPENTNAGAPGDTGCSNDALELNLPAIRVAKYFAGIDCATSGIAGHFDVITEIVVQNVGSVPLTNLGLMENLSAVSSLGTTFIGVTQAPQIVALGAKGAVTNAAIIPMVNAGFSGIGNLLTGASGLLNPGEIYVLRFKFEVNPGAVGAPAVPKNQVTATGSGLGPSNSNIVVSDLSDMGDIPQSTNPGYIGNSGGTDDPTLLTDCGSQLNSGIACNDMMQVSLNQNCELWLTPNMVLAGQNPICSNPDFYPLGTYYQVFMVTDAWGTPLSDLNPATPNIFEISGSFINQTLTVKIQDKVYKNSCWGKIAIEDKLAPIFNCLTTPLQVFCTADLANVPPPTVIDNCDPNPILSLIGQQTIDNNICDDGIYTVRRTYKATDNQGNMSLNCVQNINIVRPPVDFPDDITWGCTQYTLHPNIVNATKLHPAITDTDPIEPGIDVSLALSDTTLAHTGSGVVNVSVSSICAYSVLHSDQQIAICGTSFKIIRTWTVIDWCTGDIITTGVGGEDNVQVIKVMDKVAPSISRAPFNVSVNVPAVYPAPCKSTGLLLAPTFSDACNTVTVQIITAVGEAIYVNGLNGNNGGNIPAPGLPIGMNLITYIATDACGNSTSINVVVTVVDDITPTTVCVGFTEVDLPSGQNPTAIVQANTFNSGSFDNCCLHHFEARRMDDGCNDGHDDTVFGPSVQFCCNDVANSPIMVVVRAFDCFGNFNDCMVQVTVNDKQPPVLVLCPANQRINCDVYASNYELQLAALGNNQAAKSQLLDAQFAQPTFADNCTSIVVNRTFASSISQCKEGTITRTWTATDAQGQTSATCTQTVFVDHVSDFVVTFPKDTTVNCGQAVPSFGEPTVFNESCEMIAVSFDDSPFEVVPGACYKVIRTWTVINWCALGAATDNEVIEVPESGLGLPFPHCDLDGDGDCDSRTFRDSWTATQRPSAANANVIFGPDTDPDSDPWDGYITYNQIIKVVDTVSPVFASCTLPDVCVDSLICTATFTLPTPVVSDCSAQLTVTANTPGLGVGFGPFTAAPGTYITTFTANDGCNNAAICTDTFQVMDCKDPVIACVNGFIVEIMNTLPPFVTVNADELDAGSFDNCTNLVAVSFSPNVNDTTRTYLCPDIGVNPVQIWFTDEFGNQDFCTTTIDVQNNFGQCPDDTLTVNLGGQILTETSQPVGSVSIGVSGLNSAASTNAAGIFFFPTTNVGDDVTIVPSKDDNPLAGVTTYDLVILSKHILNIATLDSPYKLIAADVNNSKTITTFDMVEIRKLILHINSDFPSNTSWRFVDKDYQFPVPSNPWFENFPEIISINDIPASVLDADFVAVKIGDVNASYSFAGDGNEERSSGTVVFETQNQYLQAGQTCTLRFKARDFEPAGYQFTLEFDPDLLEFEDVTEGQATDANFGYSKLSEGAIMASWNEHGERDSELPDFTLVFKAKKNLKLANGIGLSDRFVRTEAYNAGGDLLNIGLQFTENESLAGFELYQNKPNPFSRETVIGFRLPEAGPAKLTIMDAAGKVLTELNQPCTLGYNEFKIKRETLGIGSGVLYYRLTAGADTATKIMVVQ